jgi:hypothetical protein
VILKSRQIGATWYFAREALVDAVKLVVIRFSYPLQRHRRIFSKNILKVLLIEPVVWNWLEIQLFYPITIKLHLSFLGTNYRTAQGHHGNFYFDEFSGRLVLTN